MVVAPGVTPKTMPLVPSMNATAGLVLAHVPPLVPLVNNCVVVFWQMEEVPLIVPAEAPGLTVIL